ncbi:hypothetical protein FOZ63_000764, partial [Perkinsus olseni]
DDLTAVKTFTQLYEDGPSKEAKPELRQEPNNYEQYMILFLALGTLTLVLHPAMTLLWLGRNTGNPNFLFFSNLTHQGVCGVAAAIAVSTSVRVRKENKRRQQRQQQQQQPEDHKKDT